MSVEPPLRFALRRAWIAYPESWLGGVLLGVALGLALGWATWRHEMPPGFEAPLAAVALGCLLLAAGCCAWGAVCRREAVLVVELGPSALVLPSRHGSRRRLALSLGEIREAQLVGGVFKRLLVAPERGPRVVLPARGFVDAEGAERLLEKLRHRVAALPEGEARLRGWDRASRWAETGRGRVPWISLAIALACVLGFAVELRVGALGNPETMLALGANDPVRVWQGELHRLVTANLLHGSVLHLAANLALILLAGSMLERLLGWQRFAVVAGISAIGGSFTAALDTRGYSTGISTLGLGLIGCWGVLNVRFANEVPAPLRVSRGLAILAVLQFALYELVTSRSDLSAHIGGLLFGALATFAVTRDAEPHRMPLYTPRWLRCAAAVVGVVMLWGLVQGLQHALLTRAQG